MSTKMTEGSSFKLYKRERIMNIEKTLNVNEPGDSKQLQPSVNHILRAFHKEV